MNKRAPIFGKASVESKLERSRHSRAKKAKNDMQQTVFYQEPQGETCFKGNPNKYAQITTRGIDPFQNTTCPFCLSYHRLRAFLISTKKGFDRGTGKCPSCGLKMHLKTLVSMEKWTPEEYARFVFDYRSSGFWQKINFATWKNRLRLMKWTERFWNEYKLLRGDAPDPQREKELEEKWKSYEESFKE